MRKRFEPNRRLLQILVGSSLYGDPDACIRELLQNGWDAIQLRKEEEDTIEAQLTISYSNQDGWFQISDNGIGMTQETINTSFLEVGENKIKALGIEDAPTQIGYFGIGVLSIFLLAEKFQVITKSTNVSKQAIQFTVSDLDEYIEFLPVSKTEPGTSIKVYPKTEIDFQFQTIPHAVKKYARHVPNIILHSIDNDSSDTISDSWNTSNLHKEIEVQGIESISRGKIGFLPTLRHETETLKNHLTICNAGFLAEEAVGDLLPNPTFGAGGEIDLKPGSLTIGMSRERFQRDQHWLKLGNRLQDFIIQAAIDELEYGDLKRRLTYDSPETKRNILLWYHFIPSEKPFTNLHTLLDDRIFRSVAFDQMMKGPTTLEALMTRQIRDNKIYFRQLDQQKQLTQDVDDEGIPIRIYQEIRNSVRVDALRAKGFFVIDLKTLRVNVEQNSITQTIAIPEEQLVIKCLSRRGIELINMIDAPNADMDMSGIERMRILKNALPLPRGINFAFIGDSQRRVVTDHTNKRYINLNNLQIQELLKYIPDSASNLLKNRLLEIYLYIEDFKLGDARKILLELLKNEHLETLASTSIAPLTKELLQSIILEELEWLNK